MNLESIIENWENGWKVSLSEQYKDINQLIWVDAKFSKPTITQPIPTYFIFVKFKIVNNLPISYLIECDKTEKSINYPITDSILQMYIKIKSKGANLVEKYGLLK